MFRLQRLSSQPCLNMGKEEGNRLRLLPGMWKSRNEGNTPWMLPLGGIGCGAVVATIPAILWTSLNHLSAAQLQLKNIIWQTLYCKTAHVFYLFYIQRTVKRQWFQQCISPAFRPASKIRQNIAHRCSDLPESTCPVCEQSGTIHEHHKAKHPEDRKWGRRLYLCQDFLSSVFQQNHPGVSI